MQNARKVAGASPTLGKRCYLLLLSAISCILGGMDHKTHPSFIHSRNYWAAVCWAKCPALRMYQVGPSPQDVCILVESDPNKMKSEVVGGLWMGSWVTGWVRTGILWFQDVKSSLSKHGRKDSPSGGNRWVRAMKEEGVWQVQGGDGPRQRGELGVFWPWSSTTVLSCVTQRGNMIL